MLDNIECPSCRKLFSIDESTAESSTIICPHCKSDLKLSDERDVTIGTTLGDYVVKRELGVGGMGTVFLAEQKSMGREVALKVLQPSLVANKSYLMRFQREIRNLANVEHPNVVAAIEAGNEGDRYFFSMTYVPGDDLKKRLERGEVFAEKEALRIALEVAKALKYAWEKHGILHRDIKPANIIVTPTGDVRLMDLGISKRMLDEDIDLTVVGMMVGSPMYISPEQARGERDLDFRADMYSLGATLFHMLVGRPPYEGDNSVAIISRHFTDPIPDPRRLRPELSPMTTKIIAEVLGKKRADRYASWGQFIEAVETLLEEEPLGGASDSEPQKAAAGAPVVDLAASAVVVAPRVTVAERMARLWGVIRGAFSHAVGIFVRSLMTRRNPRKLSKVRISILCALLLLALAACAWMIRESVETTRREKAETLLAEAEAYMNTYPPPDGTVEAWRRFDEVRKIKDKECSAKAQYWIDELKKKHMESVNSKKRGSFKRDLEELKSQSRSFERKGEFDKAMEVWRAYQEDGQFAKELKMEIDRAIRVLEVQKADRNDELWQPE